MSLLVAMLHSIATPFINSLKRALSGKGISPLTIAATLNFFGHPFIILFLVLTNQFHLPTDLNFHLAWLGLVGIAAIHDSLFIIGLTKTRFLGADAISKTGFVISTVLAVTLLGERLKAYQVLAVVITAVAIAIMLWPAKKNFKWEWDTGLIWILAGLVLGSFGTIFYKIATLHTPDYATFLSGRVVMDLIYWGLAWLIGTSLVFKKRPLRELKQFLGQPEALWFLIGGNALTILHSWLVFQLPVTTLVLIGTLSVPIAYFIGKNHYKEKTSPKTFLATAMIIGSIVMFILSA